MDYPGWDRGMNDYTKEFLVCFGCMVASGISFILAVKVPGEVRGMIFCAISVAFLITSVIFANGLNRLVEPKA